jgi:hypothetical protein
LTAVLISCPVYQLWSAVCLIVEWRRASFVCQNSFIMYDTVLFETSNYLEIELYSAIAALIAGYKFFTQGMLEYYKMVTYTLKKYAFPELQFKLPLIRNCISL